jgi:hypothetical protein
MEDGDGNGDWELRKKGCGLVGGLYDEEMPLSVGCPGG